MKSLFYLLIILGISNVYGQINVGPIEHVKKNVGEFETADLEKLRETKTLFLYRDSDEDDLELFKSSLREAWDYTELEFASYKEFSSNTYDEDYSFFTIGGLHKTKTSSSGMVTENTYFYLTLWMLVDGEKKSFCRIELYPTFPTYQKASMYASRNKEKMMKSLYGESILHNWNIFSLKNALQFVNNKLEKSTEHWVFNSEVYADLSVLTKETLYIPDYTLIKFSPMTGDESRTHSAKKLMKNYPYNYEIVSVDELTDMIATTHQPFYYLSYIKSSTDKFISIVNSETGEVLYSNYSPVSYNIKSKDIKAITKAISKGN